MFKGYDFELFFELGGNETEPPYVDTIEDINGRMICRIFVCADCLTWKEFREQAAVAAQAHLLKKSPMYEGKFIEKKAAPIADKPHYILDESSGYAVYVNIQCPNEAEYEVTKSLARLKIEEIQKAKDRFGVLWKTQVRADLTKYPVSENERTEAQAFLRRLGIR